MKKSLKPDRFMNEPYFKGGDKAMKKYIGENLRYPKDAIDKGIQGDVELKYDINSKGKVIGVTILKGLHQSCDKEAERLVKMLRFDVQVPKGVKAVFHRKIKIHFRLPKKKPVKLAYTMTSSKKASVAQKEGKKKTSYQYSIKIKTNKS